MNGRLYGIDLARFIAIAGMMLAHLAASRWPYSWLEIPTDGFPSTLFAVLGGFGVTFASRRYLAKGQNDAAIAATVVRGIVIIFLGIVLRLLPDHPILIVLVPFGTAIALSALVLRAPSWVLAAVAAALMVIAPPLLAHHDFIYGLSMLLSGTYPPITWFTYLLIGMLLARAVLKARADGQLARVAALITGGGILVCGVGWGLGEIYLRTMLTLKYGAYEDVFREGAYGHPPVPGFDSLFVLNPHSGSLIDVARTAGGAAAVIGLCLLATLPWKSGVPAIMKPFVGAGSAPLTSYVTHLVMTSFGLMAAGGVMLFWDPIAPAWIRWWIVWQLLVILAIGAAVAWSGKRGPLETLVSKIAGFAAAASIKRGPARPIGTPEVVSRQ